MRIATYFALLVSMTSCGGGASSSGETQAPAQGGGGESTATSSEMEGFDSEGFEQEASPTVEHGRQSARELIGIVPPPKPFDRMTDAEKEDYMVGVVLPIHAEIFAEFDGARYAQFQCVDCHGEDGAANHYRMPSRSLPPLPREGTPAWRQAADRNPRMWTFMTEQVLPAMRTQLGEDDTSCFTCHPTANPRAR